MADFERNEVKEFAEQMEIKLRENDHKGGWKNCSYDYLFSRIQEELDELYQAVMNGARYAVIMREAADVGNFAMMISDVAKEKAIAKAPLFKNGGD